MALDIRKYRTRPEVVVAVEVTEENRAEVAERFPSLADVANPGDSIMWPDTPCGQEFAELVDASHLTYVPPQTVLEAAVERVARVMAERATCVSFEALDDPGRDVWRRIAAPIARAALGVD